MGRPKKNENREATHLRILKASEEIFGRYASRDMIDEKTGRIYIEAGDEVSAENLEVLDAVRNR